jgi:hypothetical protein
LVEFLQSAGIGEVLVLSGDDDDEQRGKKTTLFRSRSKLIMVSTDAAAEGLNLHQRCHHLLHVELPFNPNRLEQRNGRIDRYGQTKDPIVRYLYLANSFEERILLRLIAKYERQRSRLTFVPNTLGGITSTEALTARLLQGLAEEEGWLLKEEQAPYFTLEQAASNEGSDPATRELLEEIDRSLAGFEKAARTHTWLADAGLNAEQARVTEADQAMHRGQRESTVDLSRFVTTAVLLDGGSVHGRSDDPFFSIELPPAWGHAAEEMPGYEPTSRRVWLTVHMEVTQTDTEVPVAFLGRGHPLVRRALDRVRHIAFGKEAGGALDIRVSAVEADVRQPGLLFTYLGRIVSKAGREYERVIAVRVAADGRCEFLPDAEEWTEWLGKTEATVTAGVWERHFSQDWATAMKQAAGEAVSGFAPVAAQFTRARCADLEREEEDLNRWFKQRAEDIAGAQAVAGVQQSLFGGPALPVGPAWQTLTEPRERLAGFIADASQPHTKRHEAEGVLRLHKLRDDELHARMTLNPPEIVPLGALMVVPKTKGAR